MTRSDDKSGWLLSGLALLVLAAFLAALVLQQSHPVALRHVLFAVGVMPLILGSMLYFVPVLTRSRPVKGALLLVPAAALLLGMAVVFAMSYQPVGLPGLAACVLLLVSIELGWILRRRARVLGAPHAGIDWYVYALAMLALALVMIVSRAFWPEHWPAVRNMHLHLNLFGFIGLTAVGTLRVLLPTVLGVTDPVSLLFLRRQLPVVVLGALAIALGAAFSVYLAICGALAWMWTAVQLLRALRQWNGRWLGWHAASTSLGAAAYGWLLLLAAGIGHALGVISSEAMFAVLIFGFLLPLVTGATSHLLPVWRWPGRATDSQSRMRRRLVRFSGIRVLAFWSSAVAGLVDLEHAFVPAALALAVYLVQTVTAFLSVRSAS